MGRRIPGEGAAQHPVAAAQAHRQQVALLFRSRSLCRLGDDARSGEAQQQAAPADPVADRRAVGFAETDRVGHDHHRKLTLQQRLHAALAQFRERLQRAGEKVGFTEQGLAFLAARIDQADGPPPPAFVEQGHGAGGGLSLDGDAGDAVAHFRRQVEERPGFGLAGGEQQRGLHQDPPVGGKPQSLRPSGAAGIGPQGAGHQVDPLGFRRQHQVGQAGALLAQHMQAAEPLQGFGQSPGVVVAKPVGQPDHG